MKKAQNLDPKSFIIIKGAQLHNLKNIDVAIPRNKITVITGLSGSGKSSLAFDTLYAEKIKVRFTDLFFKYYKENMDKYLLLRAVSDLNNLFLYPFQISESALTIDSRR